ncbi:MAG: hypothetical protein V7L05_02055 [Nostoc sp.]|uniref:hypothetical protein n=1 Tax=Nostoc sp. TaxID=1180 RepID=UPI002FFC7CE4
MQSTLFTTLTATEEANLSGGNSWKKWVPAKKPAKPATPATPATPAKPTITVSVAPVTQTNTIVNTGDVKGDLTQVGVNTNG